MLGHRGSKVKIPQGGSADLRTGQKGNHPVDARCPHGTYCKFENVLLLCQLPKSTLATRRRFNTEQRSFPHGPRCRFPGNLHASSMPEDKNYMQNADANHRNGRANGTSAMLFRAIYANRPYPRQTIDHSDPARQNMTSDTDSRQGVRSQLADVARREWTGLLHLALVEL